MITGNEISYIYPDGETALYGHFEDRFMKKAYHHDVEKYSCNDQGILYVEKYSERKSEQIYEYELPTNTSFGGGGTFPDPFEGKFLKLQKSSGK